MFSSFVKPNVICSAPPNIFAGLSSSFFDYSQWYEVVLGMRGVCIDGYCSFSYPLKEGRSFFC